MMAAGCPSADALGALLAGNVSEDARAQIANHASGCGPCHAVIEALVDARANDVTEGSGPSRELVLQRGARIGRYSIEERLGAGGMGVVHAAVDTELQRRVAIKLLRPDQNGDLGDGARERLMREARTLARLSHPNVVTVFDVGTHGTHLFLAMELVDGGNLGAWLRRERRKTDDVVERMIEAGRGLAAAHTFGIVHRDVKPDNILVGLDGRARVTDFGLARLADAPPVELVASPLVTDSALTRTGTLMGTPAYMAPEQLARGKTTAATDQWSFCATLYETIAGVRPFVADDLAARTSAIAEGRLAAPTRRVPASVRNIILRGLREDPAERWPSMEVVVKRLERRHRARRVIVSALAAAAVLVLVVGFSSRRSDPPPAPSAAPTQERYWTDMRAGCQCPLSACTNGCVSVCNKGAYTLGAGLAGINVAGHQEVLLGVSGDGNTVLYLTGEGCNSDRLMLARRAGASFVPTDLTDQLDASIVLFEECCTLAHDGKSIIFTNATKNGFIRARVDGSTVAKPEGELGDFIPVPTAGRTVRLPVISADGLTMYYRLDEVAEDSLLAGPFQVERADASAPFANPRRLTGRARSYENVSGVSSDGMSLFMTLSYETYVLVRASKSEAFAVPGLTLKPSILPGWRAKPLGDCGRILTTSTPGGCEGEDIAYVDGR